MDQIQHDKIKEKLAKIKALAERGVGGEKETAMRMYEELKARYEIEDEEITLDEVTVHWFSYKNDLEEDLLTQIFYMVTGSASYRRYTGSYSRRKKRGCDCTEVEAAEITMKILENCKYILIGDRYGISEGMKAEMTFAAVKGKIMLYEKDGKIYLVNSRQETTGGMDHE